MRFSRTYPGINLLYEAGMKYIPAFGKGKKAHLDYAAKKTANRLDTNTDRQDFMSYVRN